jgi:hypothetical protein
VKRVSDFPTRLHLPSSCTALGEITEKKKGEEGV